MITLQNTFRRRIAGAVFGLALGAIGVIITWKLLGGMAMLGIFLLLWSNNISMSLTLTK